MVGKRLIFIAIGLMATGIALIGIWLPGVPTVPFLLIALWALSRSSNTLHRKLVQLPLLSAALKEARAYEKHKSVTMKTKIIAQTSAWASVLVLAAVTQNGWLIVAVAAIATACSVFMFMTPTRLSDMLNVD